MAISLVASGKSPGRLAVGATTSSAANASGANLGVLVVGWYNGPSPTFSITDNSGGGNTWTRRVLATTPTPFGFAIWDCQNGTFINGMTVTVTTSGTSSDVALSFGVAFYSGVATSSPIDGTPTGFGGSSHTSTIQAGAVTSTQSGDLFVAGLLISDNQTGIPGAITINSSFTIEQQLNWVSGVNEGFALADFVQGSAASLNPTWSGLNGTLENAAGLIAYKAAAGAGVTGSAAWTEAKDTWAGTGTVLVSGSAAWTEAKDIWSGTGTLTSSGSAAWTEAQDTWAGTGTVASGVSGTASWTEAQDTWAGTGTVLVSGSAAWTEAQDIWAGTGTATLPSVTGSASWTEAQDTWAGTGTILLPVTGSASWTEQPDVWSGQGTNGAQSVGGHFLPLTKKELDKIRKEARRIQKARESGWAERTKEIDSIAAEMAEIANPKAKRPTLTLPAKQIDQSNDDDEDEDLEMLLLHG